MAHPVFLTDDAARDLEELHDFISRHDMPGKADYVLEQLEKAIAGMEALAKNGFRYPFAQYGIQQDVRAGMAISYPDRK